MALLLFSAACGTGSKENEEAGADSLDTESSRSSDYNVVLAGALVDTIKGRARFGLVVDPTTNREFFLLELESPIDFAGGFFITRGDTVPPVKGSISLEEDKPQEGKTAAQDEVRTFKLIYRQDLMREMRAVSGTLTFRHVSDTLIEGSFNAVLRGRVRRSWEGDEQGEVSARGRFSARAGAAGYAIGL